MNIPVDIPGEVLNKRLPALDGSYVFMPFGIVGMVAFFIAPLGMGAHALIAALLFAIGIAVRSTYCRHYQRIWRKIHLEKWMVEEEMRQQERRHDLFVCAGWPDSGEWRAATVSGLPIAIPLAVVRLKHDPYRHYKSICFRRGSMQMIGLSGTKVAFAPDTESLELA